MHRSVSPLVHGIIDYAMVLYLAAGPSMVGFHGKQVWICWALAVVHLLLTAATRFPPGIVKAVRFPLHGAIEFLVGLLLMVLPWLANFSKGLLSRNFFVATGALILVIWFLTDYRGVVSLSRAKTRDLRPSGDGGS